MHNPGPFPRPYPSPLCCRCLTTTKNILSRTPDLDRWEMSHAGRAGNLPSSPFPWPKTTWSGYGKPSPLASRRDNSVALPALRMDSAINLKLDFRWPHIFAYLFPLLLPTFADFLWGHALSKPPAKSCPQIRSLHLRSLKNTNQHLAHRAWLGNSHHSSPPQ